MFFLVGNVMVGTYAKEGSIPSKSPKRGVLTEVGALKESILDIIGNIRKEFKG